MGHTKLKRADWVRCLSGGPVGFVKRAAKDGSWADVIWPAGPAEIYVKRMQAKHLVVEHTIPIGDGYVTDITRRDELEKDEP